MRLGLQGFLFVWGLRLGNTVFQKTERRREAHKKCLPFITELGIEGL